jgi:hypothetical protein
MLQGVMMNDEELRAWHQAEANRTHAAHMNHAQEAAARASANHMQNAAEGVQRAQLAAWNHDAEVKARYSEVAQAHSAYQARPTPRTYDNLVQTHRTYVNTVYGIHPREPVDPGRFPQAPVHHWWQVWKRK